jgi:hypothetical protein
MVSESFIACASDEVGCDCVCGCGESRGLVTGFRFARFAKAVAVGILHVFFSGRGGCGSGVPGGGRG